MFQQRSGGGWAGAALVVFGLAAAGRGQEVGPSRNARVGGDDPLGEAVGRIVYLDQGWSPRDSQRFYFTPQGSQLVPYDWFLALEQAGGEDLVRDDRNLARLRYLTQAPDAMNPDGLPVGFVRDRARDGRIWLGLTCAACHTAQVNFNGVGYRIDGGPSLGDVTTLLLSVTEALKATRDEAAKFDRFATRVLAPADTRARRAALRQDLARVIATREGYNARNFPPGAPAGHGRVDAFGAIMNEVFHRALGEGAGTPVANTRPADAPTSYPFLWDTPQHDKVQWVGNANNGGPLDIGSLGRNVGEVLGVFADLEIPGRPGLLDLDVGYSSSVKLANLKDLEEWLRTLWSPRWPAAFPPIDPALRDRGGRLYAQYCVNCHALIDRKDPGRKVRAILWDAGTDPRTANNFWGRTGRSGRLRGAFVKYFPTLDGTIDAVASADDVLGHVVIGTIVGAVVPELRDLVRRDVLLAISFRRLTPLRLALTLMGARPGPAYKARPLNGIWATAPYLHNGSVPSLAELLKPADARVRTFTVGSRQFDPAAVGFRTDLPGVFVFRTHDVAGNPIPGNSNAGHEYGTGLGDDDRRALLEYLKSL